MAVSCPLCRIIKEELVVPPQDDKTGVCLGCKENDDLMNLYSWYRMVYEIQAMSFFFTWVWPVILVLSMVLTGHSTGAVVSLSIAMTLWAYNVFWLYPRRGLGWKWWKRSPKMEQIREQMFVTKVRG